MNVPLLNSEQLYQALRRVGRVETELVIYPDQCHGSRRPSYQKDRYERYIAWYDRYLQPGAAAGRPQARGDVAPRPAALRPRGARGDAQEASKRTWRRPPPSS